MILVNPWNFVQYYFDELNYLEFYNQGNRAWESWNKYSSYNFLFTRVHTHFLLKTLTYTKYSLTLTGKYKKSKVVVSWHCGRVQSQNDVHLHVIQKTMNDPHTVTQKWSNNGFRRLSYHCVGTFFLTEVGINRAYVSRHTNKNPKVKKVMCIESECQLFFFVLSQHDSSSFSFFFRFLIGFLHFKWVRTVFVSLKTDFRCMYCKYPDIQQ